MSGIVKGCALNLGFGAVPQLLLSPFAAAGGEQKEEKGIFREHPDPRQRAAASGG